MTDVERLLERFARGDLLRPNPAVPNLVDLAQALAQLAGAAGSDHSPGAAALVHAIGPAEHLIFILADGLGSSFLAERPADSFLRRHQVAELRSIFPSTTAAALTTLATGAWPNQHGVIGQWTCLPEIRGAAALLPFAARAGGRSLTRLGVSVEQVFPLPTLLSALPRDVLALLPSSLVNSVASTYFCGGRPRLGYDTLPVAVETVIDRVAAATAPTYTYVYTPRIDTESHWMGSKHFGVRAIVNELEVAVERLAAGVDGHARIVVAADHGMVDAPINAKHHFKPSPDLFGTLRWGPSGDDRVMYFHLQPGAEARFRDLLAAHYGDRFALLTVGEAEALELFGPGPISPLVRDRFGDLILISTGADVIEYILTGQVGKRVDLNAYHSGLTPGEMRVPLIVV
jgi:hypothetical protein